MSDDKLSNVKFSWDLEAHDKKIPEKQIVDPIICPACGCDNFSSIQKHYTVSIGGVVRGIQHVIWGIKCLGCGAQFAMEDFSNVRKGPSRENLNQVKRDKA